MKFWILGSLLILLLVSLLGGCDERFRYPCQDPENWENKECKKPYCSANGTCPEDLRHYEKNKTMEPAKPAAPQACAPVQNKGVCK